MKKIHFALLAFALLGTAMAQEEADKPSVRTGWTFGVLPSVAFDADLGFQYGALTNIYYFGDGAAKCAPVLTHPNASFVQTNPVASAMMPLAEKAWNEKRFENTAYFEPFYLKEFVATVSRKKLF